jgi:hypothetical protein
LSAKPVVPVERIELPTFGLQNRCSTAELNRRTLHRRAVKYQTCPARATARISEGLCQAAQPMLVSAERIKSAGEKRHGERAAVDGCIGIFGGSDLGRDRGPGGGPRILQAIFPSGPQPGAWRIGQPALRRRHAGRAMVDGFCGSLRVVPRCFLWRRRRRAGCADAVFERLPVAWRASNRRRERRPRGRLFCFPARIACWRMRRQVARAANRWEVPDPGE